MSTVTASVVDVSGTSLTSENENRVQNNTGQCLPVPLPALGTQRIIQGNGTNVGTVISLQCPARHRLVGSDLMCVMGTNSTQWVGETYCKPLTPYEDYGFRVAVVASIVSSAIILLMSVAFITCCLLDCLKEEEKRKQERETQLWQQQERVEQWEERSSRYSHKGRNNNNNTQDKGWTLWDSRGCGQDDGGKDTACRCNQHYSCDVTDPSLASTFASSPRSLPLPGHGYCQPLFIQNSALYQNIGPLHSPSSLQPPPCYQEPSWTPCQALNAGQVKNATLGPGDVLLRQYGAEKKNVSSVIRPTQDDSLRKNIQSTRECSIRIISV